MCVETANLDHCDVHVQCDSIDCTALSDPQSLDEYKEAYIHWRDHAWLNSCAHGQ
jgi:hypothetical protein